MNPTAKVEAGPRKGSGASYVVAWAALLCLTGLSFGFSRLRVGAVATPVALVIAGVKAGIVAMVFMHLRHERFVTKMVALTMVLFVALLCLGMAADVVAR